MPNVVGERFQITIDKQVREELGIQPGDQAVEWVEDGRLVIGFLPRPHSDSMLGILKEMTGKSIDPVVDWAALKERAWAARSAEISESLASDSRAHQDPSRRDDVADTSP